MSRGMLINVKNLSASYLEKTLFTGLSFSVERGELLALVGANGCGKSTILHLIEDRIEREDRANQVQLEVSGEIVGASSLRIRLLPQHLRDSADDPIREAETDGELVSRQALLSEMFGLSERPSTATKVSEGELQKRAIINALLSDSDLLLLDEPTNYLDIAGITAFEDQMLLLKQEGKGMILVTHDRTLADNLADCTILIEPTAICQTIGGASQAWSVRSVDISSRQKQAKDIKKKIGQLQDDMRAKSGWAAAKERQIIGSRGAKGHISKLSRKMAKRAKVVQRRAEKEVEKLESTKPFVPKQVHLAFPEREIRNRQVFALENVTFSYPSAAKSVSVPLLEDVTLAASTKEKICLMGANGSGKSTIMRLAMNDLSPNAGRSQLNDGVRTAFVPQGLAGFFEHDTLLDNFFETGQDETTIRRFLGGALIRKGKSVDTLKQFSYGELMRAAIVKCILSGAEFLFLDEPTSHLDIESIEVLEQMLEDYRGGFLLISHDRSFVGNVAERLYLLADGHLRLV